MKTFGWINTYQGIAAPYLIMSFGIFLMRQHIAYGIPDELIDAANSLRADVALAVLTRSEAGSVIVGGAETVAIAAEPNTAANESQDHALIGQAPSAPTQKQTSTSRPSSSRRCARVPCACCTRSE